MPTTIACLIYPDLTPLDVIGPLQVLSGLQRLRPDFEVVTVAESTRALPTDVAVELRATHTYEDVPNPDLLLVPGGMKGTLAAMTDRTLLDYIASAGGSARCAASVCTGSLLLGAAGLLQGRRATCHWLFKHYLRSFGAVPTAGRWVRDGKIATAAGVSAGIDLAFQLLLDLGDEEAATRVHHMLEYDPAPPLTATAWPSYAVADVEQMAARMVERIDSDHPLVKA